MITAKMIFVLYIKRPGKEDINADRLRPVVLSLFEKVLLACIVIQVLWTFYLVIPMPVDAHDALANYALKAKMFYFSNGIPDGFFASSEAMVSHPDYPLLLPMVMTWIYQFTGYNDIMINLLMPVLYIFFLTFFYAQMIKVVSRPITLLGVFMLGTIPQLYDYATIIHADLFLTVFVTSAFINFALFLKKKGVIYLVLSSVFFGSLYG